MKKLLAILLTLSLLLCTLPTMAEMGEAEDSVHRATVLNEAMLIGTWKFETDETSYVYQFEEGGKGTFNINDRIYGQVEYSLNSDILSVRQESSTSVYFRDFRAFTDETGIRLVSGEIVLTKENSTSEGADVSSSADDDAAVPDDLVGEWTGVGTPKNGGPSIDLTATINADGSGEYTFDQSGYHESYPFTISSDDSAFSVDIPADNTLGISACGGTWVLEDGVLKLDITTTFANGGSYSYTAECKRADATAAVPDWAGREWQLDTIHFKTLSEDSPYSIDGGLSLNGGSTYGNRLVLADGAVDTDIDLNGLIQAVPQLPFSVPELELTGYDSYTLDGDTLRLEPGDIEMTVGYGDDALSLTYVTHVDIQSQSMDNGLTSQAGETNLEVIMGFVPMEATPAEDSVEETAETPAEEPVDEPAEELSSIEVGDIVPSGIMSRMATMPTGWNPSSGSCWIQRTRWQL